MALRGKGVLAIWNGIHPDSEDAFLKWHVHEHIPERVILPGFERGRRYLALDGQPKFFNFYETGTLADLTSDAYQAALNAPSSWTTEVVRHFTETSRTACSVVCTSGRGEGSVIETIRLEATISADEFKRRMEGDLLRPLSELHGIVGVHLLQGQAGQRRETAETRLRGGLDEVAAWVVLVEAVHDDAVAVLRAEALPNEQLIAAGADGAMRRGAYRLEYSLSKADLSAGD